MKPEEDLEAAYREVLNRAINKTERRWCERIYERYQKCRQATREKNFIFEKIETSLCQYILKPNPDKEEEIEKDRSHPIIRQNFDHQQQTFSEKSLETRIIIADLSKLFQCPAAEELISKIEETESSPSMRIPLLSLLLVRRGFFLDFNPRDQAGIETDQIEINYHFPRKKYWQPKIFIINLHSQKHLKITEKLEKDSIGHSQLILNLKEGAKIDYFLSANHATTSSNICFFQDQASTFRAYRRLIQSGSFSSSGQLSGKGAKISLKTLTNINRSGRIILNDTVTQSRPKTISKQKTRNILDDQGEIEQISTVLLTQSSRDSSSNQEIKNLMMSPKAKAVTYPNMRVISQEAKSNHGVTTAPISEDQLNFLLARGIPKRKAVLILKKAFAHGIFNTYIPHRKRENFDILKYVD